MEEHLAKIVSGVLGHKHTLELLRSARDSRSKFWTEIERTGRQITRYTCWIHGVECEGALTVWFDGATPCFQFWIERSQQELPQEFQSYLTRWRTTLTATFPQARFGVRFGDFASHERRLGRRVVVINAS
ncbi:hypothetical protein HYW67_00520 [Candidatus Parcubacteria bacterium]|nr:hypothetical protein [Candidatus Parcubacteria bacterium]